MQIPIASTATTQSTGNLDNFINFLCLLNITNILLLQVSTETASKLFRPCSCNPRFEIYNLRFFAGVLAQLVERLNGIQEVTGSNPVGSTISLPAFPLSFCGLAQIHSRKLQMSPFPVSSSNWRLIRAARVFIPPRVNLPPFVVRLKTCAAMS